MFLSKETDDPRYDRSRAPLCPFIAAAVEIHDPDHPARVYARDYKKAFAARLTDTVREAGATNPEQLGEQLALLLDGASARSRVLNTETLATSAVIAAVLIDKAIPTAAVPLGAGGNPSAGTGRVPDAATSSAEVDAEYAAGRTINQRGTSVSNSAAAWFAGRFVPRTVRLIWP